jgi:hypothetical protein
MFQLYTFTVNLRLRNRDNDPDNATYLSYSAMLDEVGTGVPSLHTTEVQDEGEDPVDNDFHKLHIPILSAVSDVDAALQFLHPDGYLDPLFHTRCILASKKSFKFIFNVIVLI